MYVWQNGKGEFTTLQLCYDRAHDERIMRWSKAGGYSHERIDAPETKPGRAMSAILVADGVIGKAAQTLDAEFFQAVESLRSSKDAVPKNRQIGDARVYEAFAGYKVQYPFGILIP